MAKESVEQMWIGSLYYMFLQSTQKLVLSSYFAFETDREKALCPTS